MNDPFEDRLRSLKPGALPGDLASRLDRPPVQPVAPVRPRERRVLFAAAAAVAATMAAVAWHALTPPPRAEISRTPEPAAPAVSPALAGQRRTEVTRVRPVSVITDESNQPWRLIEVNWVEEDTIVLAGHPAAVRTRDQYHTVVPVALRLD